MPLQVPWKAQVDCGSMGVPQLKAVLTERGVTCKGCLEKQEFVDRCMGTWYLPLLQPVPIQSIEAAGESSTVPLTDVEDVDPRFQPPVGNSPHNTAHPQYTRKGKGSSAGEEARLLPARTAGDGAGAAARRPQYPLRHDASAGDCRARRRRFCPRRARPGGRRPVPGRCPRRRSGESGRTPGRSPG